MKQLVNIILASGSPRRKELLEQAGLDFEILVTDADETIDITEPENIVEELSKRKAMAAARSYLGNGFGDERDALIVSADTVVAYDGKVMGKPRNEKDALDILMTLSGKTHDVYTGVSCILVSDKGIKECSSFVQRTKVTMYSFSEEEALDYISTGEHSDKAGAYGIQGFGARLVERIEGDYNNVVGFPLAAFLRSGMGRYFDFS